MVSHVVVQTRPHEGISSTLRISLHGELAHFLNVCNGACAALQASACKVTQGCYGDRSTCCRGRHPG